MSKQLDPGHLDQGQLHRGQCHCGAVQYDFMTSRELSSLVLRQCDCRFCVKQGGRYASDPEGRLIIKVRDKEALVRYRFGRKTADFMFCRQCGVMPFVLCELEGRTYGLVNANTLDDAAHLSAPQSKHDYDAETSGDRLARRKKNWIGRVVFD